MRRGKPLHGTSGSIQWRATPLVDNCFYLDLPGVVQEDVKAIEATLADGTVRDYSFPQ
jgi:hypothetical protein